MPECPPDTLCTVLKFECEEAPGIYQCGGMRVPGVNHAHYNPCPSDLLI